MHALSASLSIKPTAEAARLPLSRTGYGGRVSAYREDGLSVCRDWRTLAPRVSVSSPATDLTCEVTGMLGACVRLQRLPMNSGSSPDVNQCRGPLPGHRRADLLLETGPETVIRRSHPGQLSAKGLVSSYKSGNGHFPQTRLLADVHGQGCVECRRSRAFEGCAQHPTLRANAASLGSAAVVKVGRAFEQPASRRAALYRRSFAQDRSALSMAAAGGQAGSGVWSKGEGSGHTLVGFAMAERSPCAAQRRSKRRRQNVVWQRACGSETGAAGKARVEQKAGAPQHAYTHRMAVWYAIAHDCRGTCVTAQQVLGALAQPNQLRAAVVAVLLKGSGSSPQHQSQHAFPWVMSLLARAPHALPCRSVLRLTAARRRRIHPTTVLPELKISSAPARTLAAAPIGLRGTLEPSTSPAIRARSPAPEPPALESAPPKSLCIRRTLHALASPPVLCIAATLPYRTRLRLQPGGPRCWRIPRKLVRRLAHQLQLSFSTTEPGLISGRTPVLSRLRIASLPQAGPVATAWTIASPTAAAARRRILILDNASARNSYCTAPFAYPYTSACAFTTIRAH
ncbi:uncharacterized protein M421DRAFT_89941 [Didymella exigua CBS 183.55]|uniref:Uncharacterized protein n=1 Tax=Didymella exigua CBS 183.55 TaxID=1150837 RepID=A0A6A5RWI7_9PLEO|nr:uncharacterized protein M421DRAFT_89941 [Didymella exigua CBS 183.55]KAF1931680.1 hypothetical protein M421DRAFT_89941 [Didymella exigua CBS 183.55]